MSTSNSKASDSEPTVKEREETVYTEDRERSRYSVEEEVESWAERERRRRRAWLEGPSEYEKHEWARREHRRRLAEDGPRSGASAVGPTDDEVESWAERERRRRRAWLEGPSEYEKHEWARRHGHRRVSDYPYADECGEPDYESVAETATRLRRLGELATKGAISWFMSWPSFTWASLIEAGRDWEDASYVPPRRRRIRYDDY